MEDLERKIYTVQVAFIEHGLIERHRNWGFYNTFAEAEEVIMENITDIYENAYYNYGIINIAVPGIAVRYETNWYKVDYSKMVTSDIPLVTKCESPLPKGYCIRLDY